jgi:hypothetical protein
MIAQITGPLGMLFAGVLADRVMEPAMRPGGTLSPVFGNFFGSVQGSGMSLMIAVCAIMTILVGLVGYLNPLVRNIEKLIPDHDQIPVESEPVI